MKPHEWIPTTLITELTRLATIRRDWLRITHLPSNYFHCEPLLPTVLREFCRTGSDWMGVYAQSRWLIDGPKVFIPTADQAIALEQVEVNLTLDDYQQPYPAIFIQLPAHQYTPFLGVLCCRVDPITLLCYLVSPGHDRDITTAISKRQTDHLIETSLNRFDPDCAADSDAARRALRVACNSCLALTNWPTALSPLYPKDEATDRYLAKYGKSEEARRRAAQRVSLAVTRIAFTQQIVFHHTTGDAADGPATARQVTTHWRRGHWAMLACGPNHSQRRLTFRKPALVRADLFRGQDVDTSVTYRG